MPGQTVHITQCLCILKTYEIEIFCVTHSSTSMNPNCTFNKHNKAMNSSLGLKASGDCQGLTTGTYFTAEAQRLHLSVFWQLARTGKEIIKDPRNEGNKYIKVKETAKQSSCKYSITYLRLHNGLFCLAHTECLCFKPLCVAAGLRTMHCYDNSPYIYYNPPHRTASLRAL